MVHSLDQAASSQNCFRTILLGLSDAFSGLGNKEAENESHKAKN